MYWLEGKSSLADIEQNYKENAFKADTPTPVNLAASFCKDDKHKRRRGRRVTPKDAPY